MQEIVLHYGKGHRKSKFQEYYDSFLKYALKLDEYEYWLSEMGERNISLTAFRVYRKVATALNFKFVQLLQPLF